MEESGRVDEGSGVEEVDGVEAGGVEGGGWCRERE